MTENQVTPEQDPVDASEPRVEIQEVQLVRSVRFGRLMLVGAVIGAVLGVVLSLTQPVKEGALYEVSQIAGFMLVFGGAIGLLAGGIVGLVLNLFARKRVGVGTAEHVDVQ